MTQRKPVVMVAGRFKQLPVGDTLEGTSVFRTGAVTATSAGQTSFAIPSGYTPGAILIGAQGAWFSPANYTATDGVNVVFTTRTFPIGAEIQYAVVNVVNLTVGSMRIETIITGTAGQTTYVVPGGYPPGSIIVFYTGGMLPPADYTATDGTNIVLGVGAARTTSLLTVVILSNTVYTDFTMVPYTVAQLASAHTAAGYPRQQVWCSNLAGGPGPVYSDGTNWRRYSDNTVAD